LLAQLRLQRLDLGELRPQLRVCLTDFCFALLGRFV
jgi:hypothetical protein